MIRNIALIINGRDFSPRLSTYRVVPETVYAAQVMSVNGTEHRSWVRFRDILEFTLIPADQDVIVEDVASLKAQQLFVTFSDPGAHTTKDQVQMYLDSDLSKTFLLNSSDGKIYYKGGTIRLRARRAS